jgi:WD40 repeat protein
MARAIEEAKRGHPDAMILLRFIGVAPGSSEVRPLLESICREMSGGDATNIPATYPELANEFPKHLAFCSLERPLFIFLDALDQLGETDDGRRLMWLPRKLPPQVRIVVSTLPDEAYQCFPALVATALPEDLLALPRMSRKEGADLLDTWLGGCARTLTTQQRQGVLESFQQHAVPLYLKMVFEEAKRWHSYDVGQSELLAADLPGSIHALFARLARPEQHGPAVVERALGYLAAARFGLADDEMLDLLGRDDHVRADFESHKHHDLPKGTEAVPPILWSRLYFDLEPYLSERDVFGTRLLTFYHRQITQAAAAAFLPPAMKPLVHGRLAKYLAQRWRTPDVHALLELISQFVEADKRDEAAELLLGYSWLATKIRATGISWLLDDFNHLAPDLMTPLGLLAAALRLSAHVLDHHPEELPNQILGRLMGEKSKQLRALNNSCRRGATPPTLQPRWPRLQRPGDPLLRYFVGHSSLVTTVALTRDARTALSASWDCTVILWDVSSGRKIRSLEGHKASVLAAAFSPDEVQVLSGSSDKTLKLWDVNTGREVRSFTGHAREVNCVVFSPDGRSALSASGDKTLKLWDVATGQEIRSFEGHSGIVNSVAVSPDGKTALSGSHDYTLKLWDVGSGRVLRSLEGHRSSVNCVVFNADGSTALSASFDKTLKLWDLSSGREIRSFEGHTNWVSSVAFSLDGRTALSGSFDNTLKVWDVFSGKEIRTYEGIAQSVNAVALASDGKIALSACSDNTIQLWDMQPRRHMQAIAIPRHADRVTRVAVHPSGAMALSASLDNTMKLWNTRSGHEIRNFQVHSGPVYGVALSRDGRHAVSASGDKTLKLWEVRTGREIRQLLGHTRQVYNVALSPDGEHAISAGEDGTLKLWELSSGRALRSFQGSTSAVQCVAFTPDGMNVLSGSDDPTLRLWDVMSGLELRSFKGHTNGIYGLAVMADGRTVVSMSADKTLKLWDVNTGCELRSFGHSSGMCCIALSPNSEMLATTFQDKTLSICDVLSGQVIARFSADARLRSAAWAPDGTYLFAGDELGQVHLLNFIT